MGSRSILVPEPRQLSGLWKEQCPRPASEQGGRGKGGGVVLYNMPAHAHSHTCTHTIHRYACTYTHIIQSCPTKSSYAHTHSLTHTHSHTHTRSHTHTHSTLTHSHTHTHYSHHPTHYTPLAWLYRRVAWVSKLAPSELCHSPKMVTQLCSGK